jgi:hypothetical protein
MGVPDFTITGSINGRAAEIKWSEHDGFGDHLAQPVPLALLIDRGESVCFTPTGPCWTAADHPDEVAYVTAMHAFDDMNVGFDVNASIVYERLSHEYRLPTDVEG